MIQDRAGQVWYDPHGSTYPALLLVLGGYDPTDFQCDEPGSVYHRVLMLHSGEVNGWRESPSKPWEKEEDMKRLL